MENTSSRTGAARRELARFGFTLIELLTVIAIISLLIGILVPSLARARNQAKATAGKAALKAIGDGLELFRNENPGDCPADGFPRSKIGDDPTEPGRQDIFGAQWLVRYMLGKDYKGYISPKKASRDTVGAAEYEQKNWYDDAVNNDAEHSQARFQGLNRSPTYVEPDRIKLIRPLHASTGANDPAEGLPNPPDPPQSAGLNVTDRSLEQPVFLDPFGFPILYYAANVRLAQNAKAAMSSPGYPDSPPGVYALADNGVFTGACTHNFCAYPGWQLGDIEFIPGEYHAIKHHGSYSSPNPDIPDPVGMRTDTNKHTFAQYILNKSTYNSSSGNVLAPYRKTSFLLITPGVDGIYGTGDDINNFGE